MLAGGKSQRFGRNKIIELLEGKSLLERVIDNLITLNSEIIVVIANNSVLPSLEKYNRVKVVKDICPGKGSLGGIYTGLVKSSSFYNFAIAGDMPFVNQHFLEYIGGNVDGYDVVVPEYQGHLEPLHSVYSKNCISKIELLMDQNKLSMLDLFPLVKVKYISDDIIKKFDPDHLSFFNINTEADYLEGKKLAARGK